MALKNIEGNKNVIERMIRSVENRNISHAYLLEGDLSIDKLKFAENFVKAILCTSSEGDCCDLCPSCKKVSHGNHEDLIYISADGNSIKDEAIEELQSRIKKKPYHGDRNIVIIQDADTMTLRAQNRLLKTLEEPTIGSVIILLSENIENLTSTILSRCVIFKLTSFKWNNEVIPDVIEIASMLMENHNFYEISKKISEKTATKESAQKLLDSIELWYRDLAIYEYDTSGNLIYNIDNMNEIEKKSRLYTRNSINKAIACIEEARNDLNRNLNISYTIKNMILDIIA